MLPRLKEGCAQSSAACLGWFDKPNCVRSIALPIALSLCPAMRRGRQARAVPARVAKPEGAVLPRLEEACVSDTVTCMQRHRA